MAAGALVGAPSALGGSANPEPARPLQAKAADLPGMDGQLAAVASAGASDVRGVARSQAVELQQGRVVVEVIARPGETREAERSVRALGGAVSADAPGVLEAEVSRRSLAALARADAIRFLRAPAIGYPDAVTGQGVTTTGAAVAQAAGVSGQGVRVAVIDGDFAGYTIRQAQGDLPGSLTTQNFCAGGLQNGSAGGHGAGVAEIVHEMAPDAQLYLICSDNSADLAAAEQYAKSQGVRVVNHSVSYFNTARGDGSGGPGTPDATVEDARANGILWANSAGNRAQTHWGGSFKDTATPNGFHEWSGVDERNSMQFDAGDNQCLFLKWDQWPTTGQDFNIELWRGGVMAATSPSGNHTGTQPPVEALCFTDPSAPENLDVVVHRMTGTASPRLDLFTTEPDTFEYSVAAGSVTEPGSAPETVAGGAICFQNSALEPFSSQGPTIDGRTKPDLAAPDAVSNATFGPASGCGGGFTGTSASSPHVAGAAALLAQDSSASPTAIQAALEGSATHLGAAGKNNQFGSGALSLRNGQPDLVINGIGDGAYSPEPSAEKATGKKLKPGKKRTFDVTIQNDGPLLGSMVLAGNVKDRKVSVRYLDGGEIVTNEVKHGDFVPRIGLGESVQLKMVVKASKKAKKGRRKFDLGVSNAADGNFADAAEATLKVKKRKRHR